MTAEELLKKVKSLLNVTGTYQDETLKGYIADVKEYMLDAGVDEKIVNSTSAVGTIARGVSDLWNFGSGSVKFSPYFIERVIQLQYKEADENV